MERRTRGGTILACVTLATCVALAGCGRQPPPAPTDAASTNGGVPPGPPAAGVPAGANASSDAPGSGATRADAIRARAGGWPKAEGRWNAGGIDSRYLAHFEGGELRYLEEFVTVPGAAPYENRYWFEGGALFYYAGERAPGAVAGGGPGATSARVPVIAEFAGAQVVRGISREHYGEKKLDDADLDGIRRHAQALAGAAQDEWSALQLQ